MQTKRQARRAARRVRQTCDASQTDGGAGAALVAHFPFARFAGKVIAGFAPIHDEINVWPLLRDLQARGETVALPVVQGDGLPLIFRQWTPDAIVHSGAFGVVTPDASCPTVTPNLVLVPLLAYTNRGERLGYGGGYYDRTLAQLRQQGELYACGVAYGAQKTLSLPTTSYDERLDGILTEHGFTDFK